MFSNALKQNARPILDNIYQHPFIKGIQLGNVPHAALKFYVEQDHQYLNEFARIYGRAIAQVSNQDLDIMRFLNQNINFLLNVESKPHQIFCKITNVKYDDLKHAVPSPKAYLYESHIFRAVDTGSLLNILCALLPCPWTYKEIANKLIREGADTNNNPFHEWIEFYSNDNYDGEHSMTDTVMGYVDRLAKNATKQEKQTALEFFLKSTELEWQFWEQAYYQQDWKFKDIIEQAKKEFSNE